jgi:hypothetical protein
MRNWEGFREVLILTEAVVGHVNTVQINERYHPMEKIPRLAALGVQHDLDIGSVITCFEMSLTSSEMISDSSGSRTINSLLEN